MLICIYDFVIKKEYDSVRENAEYEQAVFGIVSTYQKNNNISDFNEALSMCKKLDMLPKLTNSMGVRNG